VLSRALRHADYLRIDHVMGLQRLYTIPEGFDAGHGAYVNYRADELHALVSLEAHRAGAVVVGEDLGTVPHEVRERMACDKMLRSWVFQFESSSETPLPTPPRDAVASLGTHDLPRFGAFLWGEDIDEKRAKGELSRREVASQRTDRNSWRKALLEAIGAPASDRQAAATTAAALEGSLAHLGRSVAELVLVDLEELWDERRPQNRPGTGAEAHNWTRRASHSLAEIRSDPRVIEVLERLDRLRRGSLAGDGLR
jgi:4-alpha-glucanotransferase